MIEKKVSIIILDFNMINPEASTNMAKILNYLQVKKKDAWIIPYIFFLKYITILPFNSLIFVWDLSINFAFKS